MQDHRTQSLATRSWTGPIRPRVKSPHHLALGYVIRLERARRCLSQEELGMRAGLHRNYVGAIERGEINPTLRVLLKLQAGLSMPLSELIASTEEEISRAADRR
jgi:transcriptional regulator with XRE-family HTH domain